VFGFLEQELARYEIRCRFEFSLDEQGLSRTVKQADTLSHDFTVCQDFSSNGFDSATSDAARLHNPS
jgi:hypothetical protein